MFFGAAEPIFVSIWGVKALYSWASSLLSGHEDESGRRGGVFVTFPLGTSFSPHGGFLHFSWAKIQGASDLWLAVVSVSLALRALFVFFLGTPSGSGYR